MVLNLKTILLPQCRPNDQTVKTDGMVAILKKKNFFKNFKKPKFSPRAMLLNSQFPMSPVPQKWVGR